MATYKSGNITIEVEPYERRLDGRGFATVCSPHLCLARVYKEVRGKTVFGGKFIIGNTEGEIKTLLRQFTEV